MSATDSADSGNSTRPTGPTSRPEASAFSSGPGTRAASLVGNITAATRVIALLGDPVAHSLSPRFQNAAFRAAGVDGVYVALRCSAEDVPGLIRGIAHAGGGGNITVPHKAVAVVAVEEPSEAVQRTGACNTFWLESGRIHGDNTDVAGFDAALRALVPSPAGARVLLLGAGGAARAVVYALLRAGVGEVAVFNRSVERARVLQRDFDPAGRTVRVLEGVGPGSGDRYDIVVNATSLGLHAGDPHPLDLDRVQPPDAVLDLVYAPGETPWVRAARERGITAADGLEMLVQQGAAAFERWWGVPAPIDAMRQALRGPER